MVEHRLPKPTTRVRFPSPAFFEKTTDDLWFHCDGSVADIRNVLSQAYRSLSFQIRRFAMNPATNLVPAAELDTLAAYVKSLAVAND